MNSKIENLRREIEKEKAFIRNCNHSFDEPFFNPKTEREPYGYKMVAQGSDVWHEPQGYRDVKKDRWTRKCKVCGYEQHTNKLEPIVSGHKPKF